MRGDRRGAFDRAAFAAALNAVIAARGLSNQEAARQTGLAPSTFTRCIRHDKAPDVDSLAVLADWAQLSVDAFIIRTRDLSTADGLRRTVAAMRASEAAAIALGLLLSDRQEA